MKKIFSKKNKTLSKSKSEEIFDESWEKFSDNISF
jgi:hypothetical protein